MEKKSEKKKLFFKKSKMQRMLIAPSVWNVTPTQVTGKFKIPKLNLPQSIEFVMEPNENPKFSCSITYDDSLVLIPFDMLRYLYCVDASQNIYTIPIQLSG
jgi:hypothetical protein